MNYLQSNKINCIFFNCEDKTSSFDFKNKIIEIALDNSYIVYPFPKKRDYMLQWEEEQLINEEEKNPWNDLLNQKRNREIGEKIYLDEKKDDALLQKLYENFMTLTKITYRLEEELISHLGIFLEFYYNNFGKSILFSISDIYIFVFKI